MEIISKILKWLDVYFEEVVCAIGIAAVALGVFLQFAVRFIFGTGIAWAEEVAVYGMIWSMYIGAAMCVHAKGQMRILIVVQRLPHYFGLAIVLLADAIWLGFNIFMVIVGADYVALLIEQPMISPSLGIDQSIPHIVIPFAFALMSFRMLQFYYRWIKQGCKQLPV